MNPLNWKKEFLFILGMVVLGSLHAFFMFGSSKLNFGDSIFMGVSATVLIICGMLFVRLGSKKPLNTLWNKYFTWKGRVIYIVAGILLGIAVSPFILSTLGLVWDR
jgi:hypothetical protein